MYFVNLSDYFMKIFNKESPFKLLDKYLQMNKYYSNMTNPITFILKSCLITFLFGLLLVHLFIIYRNKIHETNKKRLKRDFMMFTSIMSIFVVVYMMR